MLQPRMLRMELTALCSPENSVLRLCVKHDPIQVEQCGFHHLLFHLRVQRYKKIIIDN